jgi:hypothetical protein
MLGTFGTPGLPAADAAGDMVAAWGANAWMAKCCWDPSRGSMELLGLEVIRSTRDGEDACCCLLPHSILAKEGAAMAGCSSVCRPWKIGVMSGS